MSTSNPPMKASLTATATLGVAWSAVSILGRQVVSVISLSVMTHLLPPTAYGLLSMSSTVTNFMETLRDLGITNALISAPSTSQRLLSSVFWINTLVGMLFSIAVALSGALAAVWFREPALIAVMRLVAVSFFIASLGVLPISLLTRQMSFRIISLAQMAGALLGAMAAITAAYHDLGVWSLVWGTLVNNLIVTGTMWASCSWLPCFVLDWHEVRANIGSHIVNLSGYNLVNYFSRNADNLIVGRYLGTNALGYYQIAYTLMGYPLSNISAVVAQVLLPAFSRISGDLPRFRAAYTRACMLISMITFPMMMGLLVTANSFVRVVLGPRWLPVVGLLLVFAPLGMFQSVFTMIGIICNATRHTQWLFRWGLWSGAAYVLSFFVGLPWGVQGVATSYAIVWLALMIPGSIMAFKFIGLGFSDFAMQLWPSLKISLWMALVVFASRLFLLWCGVTSAYVNLSVMIGIGIVTYTGLLYWLQPPLISHVYDLLSSSDNAAMQLASAMLRRLLRRLKPLS